MKICYRGFVEEPVVNILLLRFLLCGRVMCEWFEIRTSIIWMGNRSARGSSLGRALINTAVNIGLG